MKIVWFVSMVFVFVAGAVVDRMVVGKSSSTKVEKKSDTEKIYGTLSSVVIKERIEGAKHTRMLFNFESGRGVSLLVPDGAQYPIHAGGPVSIFFYENGIFQKFTEPDPVGVGAGMF